MSSDGNGAGIHRFAEFTFDEATGELSRGGGNRVTLRPQVATLLARLLDTPGELVTREDLRDELWHDGRVVSFDMAISTVVRQLRRSLGDDTRSPRFVETIPKRGYRFICPVEPTNRPARPAPDRWSAARKRVAHAAGLLFIALASLLLGGTASPPVSRSSVLEGVPSVALLPFSNLTGDPALDGLVKAVNEGLIGHLGAVGPDRVRVVGSAGVSARSERSADPFELGRRVGADFLVEGALAAGEDGDFRVRLLSAADAGVVWSGVYRLLPGRPDLSARVIASRSAGAILDAAVPGGADPAPAAATAYRQGRRLLDTQDASRIARAAERFREAVAEDSEFAAAHGHLAAALLHWQTGPKTAERVGEARAAARRALARDPDMAVAHRVLGEIALFHGRAWEEAGRHLERAVALAPGGAENRHALALWLSARGRHERAVAEIELARALDPQSLGISLDVMFVRFYARDYEGTIRAAERLRRNWPENPGPERFMVLAKLGRGDLAAAAATARLALETRAERSAGAMPAGPEDDAAAVRAFCRDTANLLESLPARPVDPAAIAQFRACSGEADRALDLIESAVAAGNFSYLVPYLGVNPVLDPLRGTLGFERILRRLDQAGLAETAAGARLVAAGER